MPRTNIPKILNGDQLNVAIAARDGRLERAESGRYRILSASGLSSGLGVMANTKARTSLQTRGLITRPKSVLDREPITLTKLGKQSLALAIEESR